MRAEDQQVLLSVAQWVICHKRKHVRTIRRLVGTEDNYLLLIREIERVEAQLFKARSLRAAATLTIVEWLITLNDFDWLCAYCQLKPFQVMSHVVPLPRGGTTVENCVPACYSCGRSGKSKRGHERVHAYLAHIHDRRKNMKEPTKSMQKLTLSLLPHTYAVCHFHPDKHIPYWALLGDFVSLTRTNEELSVVCQQENVPEEIDAERGWCCIKVLGAFDFSIAGVNASLALPLAEADISVLSIATYSTNYWLVKEENVERALQVLVQAGHHLQK
jgi:hypothetical protein